MRMPHIKTGLKTVVNRRLVSFMMVALVLAGGVRARADSKTPAVTRDFVKFCDASASDCAEATSLLEVTMLLNYGGKAGICVPEHAYNKTSLTTESVNKIRTWIAAHPGLADRPTQETLEAAMKGVWPMTDACAAQYDDDLPKTTGKFLDYCQHEDRSHKNNCLDLIMDVSLATLLKNSETVCLPDTPTVDDLFAEINAIKKWMRERPELALQPRNRSIVAACKALYPCKKP
jgi:hypothetical protein